MVSRSSKIEKEELITHRCWRKYLASLEGSHREVKTEWLRFAAGSSVFVWGLGTLITISWHTDLWHQCSSFSSSSRTLPSQAEPITKAHPVLHVVLPVCRTKWPFIQRFLSTTNYYQWSIKHSLGLKKQIRQMQSPWILLEEAEGGDSWSTPGTHGYSLSVSAVDCLDILV